MEYICKICNAIFEEPDANKQIKSILARFLILKCPYCASEEVELTERSKLLFARKNKIIKIENDNQ